MKSLSILVFLGLALIPTCFVSDLPAQGTGLIPRSENEQDKATKPFLDARHQVLFVLPKKEGFSALKLHLSKADFEAISIIQESSTISGGYRCLNTIQVANKLIRLGPESCRLAMEKYLHVAEKYEYQFDLCPYRVMLLCRLVYVPKDEFRFVPVDVFFRNTPLMYSALQESRAPLFPLVLMDGLPFLLGERLPVGKSSIATQVFLGGITLNHCTEYCSFRSNEIRVDLEGARKKLETFLLSDEFESLLSSSKAPLSKVMLRDRKARTSKFMLSQLD